MIYDIFKLIYISIIKSHLAKMCTEEAYGPIRYYQWDLFEGVI